MNHWCSESNLKAINIRAYMYSHSPLMSLMCEDDFHQLITSHLIVKNVRVMGEENCSMNKMLHELSFEIYCESRNDLLNKFSLIDQNYTIEKLSRRLFYYRNMSESAKKSISGFPSSTVNTLFTLQSFVLWNEKWNWREGKFEGKWRNEMMSTLSMKF